MVILIVGIIVSVAIGAFLWYMDVKDGLSVLLAVLGILVSLLVPCFCPVRGWNENLKVKNEYELASLSNQTISGSERMMFYVSLSSDNVYTYRYKLNDNSSIDKNGNNYKIAQLASRNKDITEIEQENCDIPKLVIYKKDPKFKSIFTLKSAKTYYAFYVPKGSINKEIKLN